MEPLIQIIRSYQKSSDVGERERLAVELIEIVGPNLERFIRSRCESMPADAEEIHQETMIAVAVGMKRFAGEHDGEFWAWAYAIARNKLRNYFAARGRRELVFVDPEILRESLAAVKDDKDGMERIELEEILSLLRESSRPCVDFLWDRYVVGLPFEVMGEQYSITDDAARKRVTRCLQLARELVSKL